MKAEEDRVASHIIAIARKGRRRGWTTISSDLEWVEIASRHARSQEQAVRSREAPADEFLGVADDTI